jgi:beta-mannosidase
MQQIPLDGEWELFYGSPSERAARHPDDLRGANLKRVSARVPGNVELDLMRAGVIPDPFYADNMRLLWPFETCEWWYVREVQVPDSAGENGWDLVFEGLDTFATVWVNGTEVGRADNMLVEHSFDVSAALKPGRANRIAVRLRPAMVEARRHHYDASAMSWERREEGLFIRKAPHMWGWDIMPRAVSAGIWRPARLEQRRPTAIEQLYYWTAQLHPDRAVLGVRFQFRTDQPDLDGFALRFRGACGTHTFDYECPVEFIAGGCHIPVPDARLWWPKGYGESNLYTLMAQLCRQGRVLDERVDHVGIRQVVVDRTERAGEPPAPSLAAPGPARADVAPSADSHFVFRVNGVPIMVKGSNWVPLDAFHSRDAERMDDAVALFDDLGCNMIRCWGGNVYEDDRFFELCDEKGILVWQDFAFACCNYPQTEAFLTQVRAEVEAVAERLRNHACLAVWCGDNEVDMFHLAEGLAPENNRLTREVIPQVLHRCDPHRAFVPSSPYVPPSVAREADAWHRTPEQHLWGPRGYFKAPFYTQHSAHFIGEIGYHGCPNVSSIERFISPEKRWPWKNNEEWELHSVYHWRHKPVRRYRIELMANQVRELFGSVPDDLEGFALASQITQAEAKKFFIESTRLRKWQTSGILWWNVLDGWPQFSDAIVDYHFGKKLAYHYIRRVQQPVCVIIGEPDADDFMPLVICNDSREPASVSYRVTDAETKQVVTSGAYDVAANENWQVGRIPFRAEEKRLYLMAWETGGHKYGNHYVAAQRPLSLEQYRAWLPSIGSLPRPFEADAVAR